MTARKPTASRFGNVTNPGAKPSEHFHWDRAIAGLDRIFTELDAKDAKRKRRKKRV